MTKEAEKDQGQVILPTRREAMKYGLAGLAGLVGTSALSGCNNDDNCLNIDGAHVSFAGDSITLLPPGGYALNLPKYFTDKVSIDNIFGEVDTEEDRDNIFT